MSHLTSGSLIETLSRKLHRRMQLKKADDQETRGLLLEIDAEILRAYDLPPRLERELLARSKALNVLFEYHLTAIT